ncbi:MAG: hypothetical protein KBE04_15430 [Phycisphaerae bacterium]|nr:hypothetical protein [Phycisphaerae bacterium]
MGALIAFLCWCILWVLCWPLALLILLFSPLILLVLLVVWVLVMGVCGLGAFLGALFMLPARALGYRGRR